MEIVKKHILSVICGVVALVALVLAFWPLGSMKETAQSQFDSRASRYQQLRGTAQSSVACRCWTSARPKRRCCRVSRATVRSRSQRYIPQIFKYKFPETILPLRSSLMKLPGLICLRFHLYFPYSLPFVRSFQLS